MDKAGLPVGHSTGTQLLDSHLYGYQKIISISVTTRFHPFLALFIDGCNHRLRTRFASP
jgi:hypothetical protein